MWIGAIMPLGFGVVLGIIYLATCRKKVTAGKRCSSKTVGTVVGYDSKHRVGDGYWPAILAYTVNGAEHRVTGPFFKAYMTKSVTSPLADNDIQVSTENDVLRVSYSLNSVASVHLNPYKRLYPIGTELDVYYNPADPDDAYVERVVGVGQYRLMGILAAVFLVLGIGTIVYMLFFA